MSAEVLTGMNSLSKNIDLSDYRYWEKNHRLKLGVENRSTKFEFDGNRWRT